MTYRVKAKVLIISLSRSDVLRLLLTSPTTLFLIQSILNTLAPSQCLNHINALLNLGLCSCCFLYLEGFSPKRLSWLLLSPSSDLYSNVTFKICPTHHV